jgi:hypothetical protein
MQYIYECDPGHGWLHVQRSELERLGITHNITSHSYQNQDQVFLEEDLDMGVFITAKEALGEPVEIKHRTVRNTPIRSYQRYQPTV